MPIGEPGPLERLSASEQARMERSIGRMQERAIDPTPAGPADPAGREELGDLPEGTPKVVGLRIERDRRGARSLPLRRRKEKEARAPVEERPPDPQGRGRSLDVQG